MSEVFMAPTGQLTNVAKHDLRKAGIVVVEVDDPSQCQFIRSTEIVSADDMLWAAFKALNTVGGNSLSESSGSSQREALARHLMTVIDATRSTKDGAA